MAAQISVEDKQGRRIYRNLLDKVSHAKNFYAIQEEFCYYLFGEMAPLLLERYGLTCMSACTDGKFREDNFIPHCQIRRQKNSRECKVFLKSGHTDFYLSRLMRELIHENPIILSALSPFYQGKTLSYSRIIDQLLIKPKGSDESYVHLDCDISKNLNAPGSHLNPYHHFNIFCISSPQSHGDSHNSGDVSILENFDRYFDFFSKEFKNDPNFSLEKQPLHQKDKTLFKNFNLAKFNNKIRSQFGADALLLKWVNLDLGPGDFAVIDCRIPYKMNRNQKDIPAVYTTVSLEPCDLSQNGSSFQNNNLQLCNEGKVGDWHSSTYKNTNYDEWAWRKDRTDSYSLQSVVPKDNCSIDKIKLYGTKSSNL